MKTTTKAFDDHLSEEVTSLCLCWRIVRTDGIEYGFTSHDDDLMIDGLLYESTNGFVSSALRSGSDLSVDNSDMVGAIQSDRFTAEELRAGAFNFASVYAFLVNWQAPDDGILKLRRGWFGEVTTTQNGQFKTELRGMTQALGFNYIEVYTPECRTDFCSKRCGLLLSDFEYDATVSEVIDRRTFKVVALPAEATKTSQGAHRYWRVTTLHNINQLHTGFAEFRAWDQDGNIILGGTASCSSRDPGYGPEKARDGDPKSYWSSDDRWKDQPGYPILQWWGIDFGSKKDIKEFAITASVMVDENPTAFRLEYSDDNKDWKFGGSFNAPWTTKNQTFVWGIVSETGDPLNDGTGDMPTLPPPYEGASTFNGGLCRFVAGRNSTRQIEIINHDIKTNTLTLFEEPAYPLVVGDTLKISQGCNKSYSTCGLYKNIKNFRGEPFVPGQDEFMRYPNAPK